MNFSLSLRVQIQILTQRVGGGAMDVADHVFAGRKGAPGRAAAADQKMI